MLYYTVAIKSAITFFPVEGFQRILDMLFYEKSASFDTKIVSLPFFSGYNPNLSYIYHTIRAYGLNNLPRQRQEINIAYPYIGTSKLYLHQHKV